MPKARPLLEEEQLGLVVAKHDFHSLQKKNLLQQARPSQSLYLGNKLRRKGTSLFLCDP